MLTKPGLKTQHLCWYGRINVRLDIEVMCCMCYQAYLPGQQSWGQCCHRCLGGWCLLMDTRGAGWRCLCNPWPQPASAHSEGEQCRNKLNIVKLFYSFIGKDILEREEMRWEKLITLSKGAQISFQTQGPYGRGHSLYQLSHWDAPIVHLYPKP